LIHSGSATDGHYYAYIKCFETNQWYDFNDERVSKLDRQDIKKAFGTITSSTTAYMLLYRQVNQQLNEKFIKVEEFDEHLKSLLEKEKAQQLSYLNGSERDDDGVFEIINYKNRKRHILKSSSEDDCPTKKKREKVIYYTILKLSNQKLGFKLFYIFFALPRKKNL
jgi:hypothetical protein